MLALHPRLNVVAVLAGSAFRTLTRPPTTSTTRTLTPVHCQPLKPTANQNCCLIQPPRRASRWNGLQRLLDWDLGPAHSVGARLNKNLRRSDVGNQPGHTGPNSFCIGGTPLSAIASLTHLLPQPHDRFTISSLEPFRNSLAMVGPDHQKLPLGSRKSIIDLDLILARNHPVFGRPDK